MKKQAHMQIMTDNETRATLVELGSRVRGWRARRGMTRKQLATDSGLSERFLADVESGKGNVSINSLEAAARALNITILDLLQDAPRPGAGPRARACWAASTIRNWSRPIRCWPPASAWPMRRAASSAFALVGLRGAGKTHAAAATGGAARRALHRTRPRDRARGRHQHERDPAAALAGRLPPLRARALLRIAEEHAQGVVMTTGGSIVSERETFDLLQKPFLLRLGQGQPREHMSRVVAQGDMRPSTPRGADDSQAMSEALEDIRRILASREALYARADAVVDTAARSVKQSMKDLERAVPAPQPDPGDTMNAMTEPLLFKQTLAGEERELVSFRHRPFALPPLDAWPSTATSPA
jgi:XRE family aerobic/anaerobic benzoate catabolism transcriptional regulator